MLKLTFLQSAIFKISQMSVNMGEFLDVYSHGPQTLSLRAGFDWLSDGFRIEGTIVLLK